MARPRRLQGVSYTGFFRYFLTICTFRRAPVFTNDNEARAVAGQLLQHAWHHGFAIHVFCVMPDHLHALCEGVSGDADLEHFVRRFKQRSGYGFCRRNRAPALWQPGYSECILRADVSLVAVSRYIVENPVRAGLVTTALDYLHWGSGQLSREAVLDSLGNGLPERTCKTWRD